jgi:putative radical SAM enzyme (TIGR03279 family)
MEEMSELVMAKNQGLVIKSVEPGSPANRAGFLPEDVVRRINGEKVDDIVDLRYHASEEEFEVEFVRQGVYQSVQMERGWGEDLGFVFTFELADQIHTCDNKCVFCFIHQMPKGMRKSLYLMDDDFRLSFLHGNYVTLTNMSEEEFARTKEQGLSPLYVSVHATDPRLRGFMLGRGAPEPILPRIKELAGSFIDVHAQIVLCPGLNDGDALKQTVEELAALYPEATGMPNGVLSAAVVPVGLSKFRHNLYPLKRISPDYARAFLDEMAVLHDRFKAELGTRFVFPSDEWFYYARRPVPPRSWYEDFPQFEDGIGTFRLFLDEAAQGLRRYKGKSAKPTKLTLVTGILPSEVIASFARDLSKIEGIEAQAMPVVNEFFGHGITVAGLITFQDLLAEMNRTDKSSIFVIPDIMLKDSALFLDNLTVGDLREASGCDVRVAPSRAKEFLRDWLPANVNFDAA